jgi:hypothetical protein
MKKFYLNTVLAACLFAGASLPSLAESSPRVDFIAPFAFHVGAATLPAGAYRILESPANGTVFIMSVQGTSSAIAIVGESRAAVPGDKPKVTFQQRGGQLVLSNFSRGDGRVAEISLNSAK